MLIIIRSLYGIFFIFMLMIGHLLMFIGVDSDFIDSMFLHAFSNCYIVTYGRIFVKGDKVFKKISRSVTFVKG